MCHIFKKQKKTTLKMINEDWINRVLIGKIYSTLSPNESLNQGKGHNKALKVCSKI